MRRAVFTIALLVAAACTTSEPITVRDLLEERLSTDPDLPVVVPVAIPEGYEYWTGPGFTTSGGAIVESTWSYRPVEGPGDLPVVELCVSTQPSPPCLRASEEIATRTVGGYTVVIQGSGPADASVAEPLWRDVELTTEWEALDWVDA